MQRRLDGNGITRHARASCNRTPYRSAPGADPDVRHVHALRVVAVTARHLVHLEQTRHEIVLERRPAFLLGRYDPVEGNPLPLPNLQRAGEVDVLSSVVVVIAAVEIGTAGALEQLGDAHYGGRSR